ncbi:MAG TPA: phosphate-starvation-inducible PsiE family protein [Mycobacteriales bacterium]|nr:phosphate-starvation-inducible PsiE family protein [Mycobacteriales bacterium]
MTRARELSASENRQHDRFDKVFTVAEDSVYAVVALLLLASCGVLLVQAAYHLVTEVPHGAIEAVKLALESLLLVFILVELLAAIRATINERKLVAEPFLLVGIIASIKEIVVTAVDARESFGHDDGVFADSMIAIGVLAGVLLTLSVATLLVRRKEREPAE